jgi:hypothetical protein
MGSFKAGDYVTIGKKYIDEYKSAGILRGGADPKITEEIIKYGGIVVSGSEGSYQVIPDSGKDYSDVRVNYFSGYTLVDNSIDKKLEAIME